MMNFYHTPFIEIVEQPASSTRFRYSGENRTEAFLGRNSTKKKKTYFKIKIHHLQGSARVSVSCVSHEEPYYVHSHGLQVKENPKVECSNGIIYFTLTPDNPIMEFFKIGIQSCKKNEVSKCIKAKMLLGYDPCSAGSNHIYESILSPDLSAVRLAVQAFVKVPMTDIVVPIDTAVTEAIYDSKSAINSLTICSVSHDKVPATGGQKIIILTEKIYKNDTEVWFYEFNDKCDVIWKAQGIFKPENIHHQRAITLKTPTYSNIYIKEPVTICIQLYRPSNEAKSELHEIKYIPVLDTETTEIRKRKRSALGDSSSFLNENSFGFCTCVNCPQHAKHPGVYPAIETNDLLFTQNYNELSMTTKEIPMNNFVDNFNDNRSVLKSLADGNNNFGQQINPYNFIDHQTPGDNIENLNPSGLDETLSDSLSSIKIDSDDIKLFDSIYCSNQ